MIVRVRAASAEDLDSLVRLNMIVQSLHVRLYPRDFKPVIGTDAKPVIGTDARPVIGTDAKPVVGPVAKPVVGTDEKPVVGTDAKPFVGTDAVKDFFAERLARTGVEVLVADCDAVASGYALWEIQPRPETPFNPPRLRAYVHHIAVAPAARRCGVATALLDAIEAQAAAKGIFDIALAVWAANLDAQQFFASRGFAAFNLSLRKTRPSGPKAMPEP